MRITVALCNSGPFSALNIHTTANAASAVAQEWLLNAPDSPMKRDLSEVRISKLANGAQTISFTVIAVGHGVAFFPTLATYNSRDKLTLVVQVYFVKQIDMLIENPHLDTSIIARLRRATENRSAFVANIFTAVYPFLQKERLR